jgi:hypothetical protein
MTLFKKNYGIACISCAVVMAIVTTSSCTKKSSSAADDASKFVGSWKGTATCGSGATPAADTLVLNAGNSGTGLASPGNVGISGTSCVKAITDSGTASGNSFTFPTKTFTDNCSNSYTISFTGTLSGSTLTVTETVSGFVSTTCVFTGTK